MRPDSYMPFYGNDFFQAVAAYDEITQLAYMKLLWNYWHVNHCKGFENNTEMLRRVAQVEKDKWPEVEGILFDNDKFFVQDEHFIWHQKRSDEEWAKACKSYEANVRRGNAGAKARWSK